MFQNQLELPLINTQNPPYKIRKSKRAKRIFLRIMPGRGLEIVVPERLKHYSIENLLEEHKSWIERTLEKYKIDPDKSHFAENADGVVQLPSEFCFEAVSKKIKILYQNELRPTFKCQIVQQPNVLGEKYLWEYWLLKGDIENKRSCQKILNRMIKKEAAKYLIPWLQKVSLHCNLPFQEVKIRLQTSLWGSCTRSHKISLNAKLLFAEPRLVQYVLVHELCHTKHLNHSARFWNLVYKFDPDFQLHRRLLKDAAKSII